MSDVDAPAAAKPSRRFRRAVDAVRLTPDQRRRQETVMRTAMDVLGSREGIMAFLNDPCEVLGGRPLDVAIDGDDGLARTMELLHSRAAAPSRG